MEAWAEAGLLRDAKVIALIDLDCFYAVGALV
jgi:hypothetical protein